MPSTFLNCSTSISRNITRTIRVSLLLASLLLINSVGLCQDIAIVKDTSWLKALPACPCMDPDRNGIHLNDGWAKDKGDLKKYHRGAASSYRSYPAIKTTQGRSAQQCCYDASGRLITSGRGAGTPDRSGVCKGENSRGFMTMNLFSLIGHFWKDVRPWNRLMRKDSLGWKAYNANWIPNKGNGCPINDPNIAR